MPQVVVCVNVYDLSEVNEYTRPLGFGIFHSGLVVHGREFSFGGHDYASSGIFETAPKAAPAPAIFREMVVVGTTEMNPGEVSNLVGDMDDDFHGNTYHLLERNCNHFVEALCFELTGKMPPGWINRLARTAGGFGGWKSGLTLKTRRQRSPPFLTEFGFPTMSHLFHIHYIYI